MEVITVRALPASTLAERLLYANAHIVPLAAVFKFFEGQKLTPHKLRELNQHQIDRCPG